VGGRPGTGRWGHLLAIGVVEVPDGTAVTLNVNDVAEVTVSNRTGGLMAFPAGTVRPPPVPPGPGRERVTWQARNGRQRAAQQQEHLGEPGDEGYSVEYGVEAVDLEFIRGLPADSVFELSLRDVVPASFAAVAHLAPGLRGLGLFLDDLGDDAPSVIADLPALEYLALMGGSYTARGLQQLRRLPQLCHLHIEREGLTALMFQFAAAMPALTRLTGLDEFGADGPMPPAEVDQVRAMLPHISMD
jgi:hypothetical protein